VPIIPILTPSLLLHSLNSYASTLINPSSGPHPSANTAHSHLTLLSLLTPSPYTPLSRHATYVLSDLFSSFKELEVATRTRKGRREVSEACAEDDGVMGLGGIGRTGRGGAMAKVRDVGREIGEFWGCEIIID
jgi:hypothetical protein